MPVDIGETLDTKYRIVRVIGVGGMGTVYEGEHTLIRRRVAIKVMGTDSARAPDAVRRFEREAQAVGQIGSDHILEVLDVGTTPDGAPYMVMEYLEGETLATRMERVGRLTPAQIASTARQVLAGLAAAHEAGIVHRDLKPDNVFILREKAGLRDFVKIIDFGISKFDQPNRLPSRLTQTGTVLGTPYYMSPEQARGLAVDTRTDLHACGVILFEAVTGQIPFDGANFNELMFQIALGRRPRVRDIVPDVDPRFDAIVAKAMERDPMVRYQTAREFAAELEAWMRSNSLATTTGEIVLADVAAFLQAPPSRPLLETAAPTIETAPESVAKRRTVTTASIDTVSPPARRSRHRWVALAASAVCGAGVATAALLVRQPAAPSTSAPAKALDSATAVTGASAATQAPITTMPGSSTAAGSSTAQDTAPAASASDPIDAAAPHASDPRRKTKPPPHVGPRPAPTGTSKQVDFGY
jgi:serine/threonine-protein kinase